MSTSRDHVWVWSCPIFQTQSAAEGQHKLCRRTSAWQAWVPQTAALLVTPTCDAKQKSENLNQTYENRKLKTDNRKWKQKSINLKTKTVNQNIKPKQNTENRNRKTKLWKRETGTCILIILAMMLCYPWTCTTVDSTELSISISISR